MPSIRNPELSRRLTAALLQGRPPAVRGWDGRPASPLLSATVTRGGTMANRSRRVVKLLWSTLAAALVALWPPPAQAGHTGHRLRPIGSHQQRIRRQARPTTPPRAAPRPASNPSR